MLQCLEGFNHLLGCLVQCCDTKVFKKSQGLEDPEIIARDTVCKFCLSVWITLFQIARI
jgi:serine/threonine-protein phosphatase 2B regulatory subunit